MHCTRVCAGGALDAPILRVKGALPERMVFDADYVRPNRPVVFAEAVPREQRLSLADVQAVLGEETMTNVFVSSTGRFLYFKRPTTDTGAAPASSVLASEPGVTLERHRMTFKCVEGIRMISRWCAHPKLVVQN
jgi:hypothetical protein